MRRVARRTLLSMICACLFSLAPALPLSAQSQDLPPLLEDTAARFTAVGRVGLPGFPTQGCSGTLIAPDLVLSAAHCVPQGPGKGQVFAAGWRLGQAVETRLIEQGMRHPGYAPQGRHAPGHDVGLIVLDAPMDSVAPIPLTGDDALFGTPEEMALVGYHIRSPDRLSGDLTCGARDMSAGLLHVACPVIQGNSGAPVLQADGAGWRVTAVISSRIGQGAIAVLPDDWLRAQIAAHLER